MKKKLHGLVFFLFLSQFIFAQGEIDDQSQIVLRNELTYAISLNSNGLGFSAMYGKRKDGFTKRTYTLDFNIVKHSKEIKLSNPREVYSGQFVYGKTNNFFTLKGGYGIQKELFEKKDKGGISIRYYYNFGPSLGIMKPIYYEIIYGQYGDIVKIEKIYPLKGTQQINIRGKAGMKYGMDEISLSPGIYAKIGTSFEFSKKDNKISAIDGGFTAEGYLRKIKIMELNMEGGGLFSKIEENGHLFISVFIAYRFGKVIMAKGIKG